MIKVLQVLFATMMYFTILKGGNSAREIELPKSDLEEPFSASAVASGSAVTIKTYASDGRIYVAATIENANVVSRNTRSLPLKGKPSKGRWRAEFSLMPTLSKNERVAFSNEFDKYKVTTKSDLPHPRDVYLADISDGTYSWRVGYTNVEVVDEDRKREVQRFIDELSVRVVCFEDCEVDHLLGGRIGFSSEE